jgi:OmpA-OmpF porin, OOP family
MKSFLLFVSCLASLLSFGQEKKPTEKEVLLDIIVTDFSDIPRKNDKIILDGRVTKKTFSCVTNEKGKCSLLVPKGDTYDVKYKDLSSNVEYSEIEVPAKEGLYTFELVIKYDPGKVFTLENVFFDTGKATLRPESFKSLNDLVEIMKLKNTMVIEIAGHTDDTGTPESNLTLSQSRAESVRNYLVSKGILAGRVTAKGYGETEPVADNATDEGKQKNRRTEVRIIKE